MGLIGAILGDICGSRWEFGRPQWLDCGNVELFNDDCFFTDDSVLSIATKYKFLNNTTFTEAYHKFANTYNDCSYGGTFHNWMLSDNPQPYNSFGNGSAMRVSYIADKFDNEKDVIKWAIESAICTHNHKEGIKGAVTTAMCSYMAKSGCSKKEIYEYAKKQYGLDYKYNMYIPLEDLREHYTWDVTCQGSVPVAIRCFLDSEDYQSFLRNVISLNCDTDTLCAIGGCIAENYYGTTGLDNDKLLKRYLDDYLYDIVMK